MTEGLVDVRDILQPSGPGFTAEALPPLSGRALIVGLDVTPRPEDPFAIRSTLEELMWENVGLVRDGPGMVCALDQIHSLQERASRLSVPNSRRLNLAWTEALDVQNLLRVAEMVTRSALVRTESRGAHYRSDFPNKDDAHWLSNVHMRHASGSGEPRIWSEPVRFTRLAPPLLVAP